MKRVTRLTVIAPGFRRALSALDGNSRAPALERLAARGEYQKHRPEPTFQTLETWQRDVARVLGAPELPSAPVSAIGAGLAPRAGTWLQAQFFHVAAGLDHLVLVPLRGEQALDATTLMQLRASVAAYVRDAGYEWLSAGSADFLHTTASLQIDTCAPDSASRIAFIEAMPRGGDGAGLRRVMTELQMQLHEHPANQRRERTGLLPANAVWLWGAGVLPPRAASGKEWGQVFTDDYYALGLCRLHERPHSSLPGDGEALLNQAAASTLVLLHCESLATLDADWLVPVERALQRGQLEQLELILDDIHLSADRWSRWRVWRRTRPIATVFA